MGLIALALLFAAGARPAAADDVATCDAVIATATQSNGFKLFEGATACAKAERQADVNYLMIAGQIRSMTDMMILTPDDTGVERAGALYGLIYYQFGGLGHEAVYRKPADAAALEARLRAFAPTYAKGYDPGWSFRASVKIDIYDAVLASQRDNRIWEMLNYALRLQNEAYFTVQQEINQLQRENNATFVVGTPAYEKSLELAAKLREIAKGIPQLPPPVPDTSFMARLNEPDTELVARQVATGLNGPARGQVDIIRSETELRASWLATALSAEALAAVLEKTDFSTHSLISYAFGEHTNSSGDINFAALRYSSRLPGYSFSINVGVISEECNAEPATSYPFVVGLVDAVPGAEIRASGYSNFGAACGPIASATATPLP